MFEIKDHLFQIQNLLFVMFANAVRMKKWFNSFVSSVWCGKAQHRFLVHICLHLLLLCCSCQLYSHHTTCRCWKCWLWQTYFLHIYVEWSQCHSQCLPESSARGRCHYFLYYLRLSQLLCWCSRWQLHWWEHITIVNSVTCHQASAVQRIACMTLTSFSVSCSKSIKHTRFCTGCFLYKCLKNFYNA